MPVERKPTTALVPNFTSKDYTAFFTAGTSLDTPLARREH
jgi:hypothetical protein